MIHTAKTNRMQERLRKDIHVTGSRYGWGNGYIGVEEDHPWYERNYTSLDAEVEVHYGLTYSGHFNCETLKETPKIWWLGFDTMHYDDNEMNCSEAFVDEQIELMKEQAERAAK